MKTSAIFVAAALAVSVSAQNFQQNNRNNNLGGFRGGFGNNQNNGGFGQNNNGRNGQNTQNKNQGQNRGGQQGQNNNNNKGNNNTNNKGNNNNNKGQATASAAATVAATTNAAVAATKDSVAATSAAVAATNTAAAAQSSATASTANSSDAQTSLTLDPKVIATGFADDGQDVPTAGQVASLTSTNNFINFCLTVPNFPITNGKQITTGSCNPAPMGVIPSTDNMPSAKFTVPKNGDSFVENTPFTITMAVANFQTGAFVNAASNYFAAPQQVNAQGQIIGHSHVTVEQLSALDQTTPTDPRKFAFFKGLNAAAVNGLLTASVDAGLPAGFYKVSSINTAANHQPVLVPVAQHGSLDDAVYFTVTAAGANATASTGAGAAASSAAATVAAPASSAAAATASATGGKVIAAAPVRGTQATNQQKNTGNQQKNNGNQQNNNNNKNQNQGNNKNQQNNGRNRRHARAFAQL